VAPRLWLHGALCLATALLFYNNTLVLIGFTLIYGIYYIVCYRKAVRLSGDNTMARRIIPDERAAAIEGTPSLMRSILVIGATCWRPNHPIAVLLMLKRSQMGSLSGKESYRDNSERRVPNSILEGTSSGEVKESNS
jgi:hypothetical protein